MAVCSGERSFTRFGIANLAFFGASSDKKCGLSNIYRVNKAIDRGVAFS